MAKLRSGVNKLELNVLQGPAAVVHQEGLGIQERRDVKDGGPQLFL